MRQLYHVFANFDGVEPPKLATIPPHPAIAEDGESREAVEVWQIYSPENQSHFSVCLPMYR